MHCVGPPTSLMPTFKKFQDEEHRERIVGWHGTPEFGPDDAGKTIQWDGDSWIGTYLSPPGTMHEWPGGAAPLGFFLCDGASKNRADYPLLFAALGGASSPYGLPSGSTFSLPNFSDKVALGKGSRALGITGGVEEVTLSTAQMPAHTHAITGTALTGSGTTSAHSHSFSGSSDTHSGHSHGHSLGTDTHSGHTHAVSDANVSTAPAHDHGGSTLSTDNPGGHLHGMSTTNVQQGTGSNKTVVDGGGSAQNTNSSGGHTHAISGRTTDGGSHSHNLTGQTNNGGSHSHSVTGSISTGGSHSHVISGTVGSGGGETVPVTIGGTVGTITSTGGSTPVPVMQPYLVVNKIIKHD